MRKRPTLFTVFGLILLTLILGFSLTTRQVYGTHGHHGHGDGDGDGDGDGSGGRTPCCVCVTPDCCLSLHSDSCDENGFATDPVLTAFLDIFGDPGDICDICSACADNLFNDDEDQQFLDICDFCLIESGIQGFDCTPDEGGDGDGDNQGIEGEGGFGVSGGSCSLRHR